MILYHDYEKLIYDWLLSKHENDSEFTFSLRQMANKGSEKDYFIGTSKSNYFGTTFWKINVGFPGSSGDCINLIFMHKGDKFQYKFEFKQTNSPNNEQNKSALNLLKHIQQPLKDGIGLRKDAKPENKMFSMVSKPQEKQYESIDEMIQDVSRDLKIILPIVDEGILKEKQSNPDFIAHRITSGEFQQMQDWMEERFEKYENLDDSNDNEEELWLQLKKTISEIDDRSAVTKFFDAVKYVNEHLGFNSNMDNVYCASLKSRIHLTIGSRYVVSIQKTSKHSLMGFNIPFDQKEKLFSKYPSLHSDPKNESQEYNRSWVKGDAESINLNDFLDGITEVATTSFTGQSSSQFKKMYSEKHNKWIIEAAMNNELREKLFDGSQLPDIHISNEENSMNNSTVKAPLNQILYGPPGTGKTYNTLLKSAEIVANREMKNYEEAKHIFNQHLGEQIEFITFHQNYSYEDFIQGLRPDIENNNTLTFDRKDGIFLEISKKALENLEMSEMDSEKLNRNENFNIGLQKFIESIEDLDIDFHIPDSVAYIIEITDKAFRYKGGNWGHSALMKFNDLGELYKADVKNRQDIKKLTTISGLANQHASYFLRVYNEIIKFIPKQGIQVDKVEKKNYVIIIDEINRANISRVFGELITLIEPDKRSHGEIPLKCKLPSGEEFMVPSNLYIIGTMNTADKSIALLDIALRRRFVFEAMYPLYEIEGDLLYHADILGKINKKIIDMKGHDFQIGHAYFMGENNDLVKIMNQKVIPLLLEYFMNDEKEVKSILTNADLEIEENSWPLKIIGKRAKSI